MNPKSPSLLVARSVALAAVLATAAAGQQPGPGQPAPGQQPGAQLPRGPMPRPVTLAVERAADVEITIDGSLIDWPELAMLDMTDPRQLSGTAHGAFREAADLSARAFLMWDADYLYFSAAVQDDWHRALDPSTRSMQEIPVADSIVLTFDPARDTRALGPTPGRRDDAEFWLAEEASQSLVVWDRLRGVSRILEERGKCVVSHDKVLGITSYEARIPWDEVVLPGTLVGPSLLFDMQIVVNDFDEGTDPMPQTRIGWTFGSGMLVDPCMFGTVRLIGSLEELGGNMPAFPDRLDLEQPPELDPRYWVDVAARLMANPPAVHDGSVPPGIAGGFDRYRVLADIERAVDRMPRIDYLEFCQRVHRRMTREAAGIEQRGLPWFWARQLRAVSDSATEPPAAGTVRLFRLPMGGWLLRGSEHSLLVDPAGADLEDFLWGATRLVVLTEPLDMTRRNDQLLLRMVVSKEDRRFLTHIAFHLPVVPMQDLPLMVPGTTYGGAGGLQLHALGQRREDGSVPWAIGYDVEFPGGSVIQFAGPVTLPDEVRHKRCAVMVLSPRNPRALAVVEAADPALVIIDDSFRCSSLPNYPRLQLDMLYALQQALLPRPSVLLGPGESWDVGR